jgi:hypothetical protein
MDEVDDDVDVDTTAVGFLAEAFQLVVGAVDQDDPAAQVAGVAGFGVVEHGGDHGRDGVLQRRVHLPVAGDRAVAACGAFGRVGGQDVGGAARSGDSIVDRGHHRHAGASGPFPAR